MKCIVDQSDYAGEEDAPQTSYYQWVTFFFAIQVHSYYQWVTIHVYSYYQWVTLQLFSYYQWVTLQKTLFFSNYFCHI